VYLVHDCVLFSIVQRARTTGFVPCREEQWSSSWARGIWIDARYRNMAQASHLFLGSLGRITTSLESTPRLLLLWRLISTLSHMRLRMRRLGLAKHSSTKLKTGVTGELAGVREFNRR
jgi:hypothetical protein